MVVVLPAPFGTQKCDNFTFPNGKGYILNCGNRAVLFGDVLNFDHEFVKKEANTIQSIMTMNIH